MVLVVLLLVLVLGRDKLLSSSVLVLVVLVLVLVLVRLCDRCIYVADACIRCHVGPIIAPDHELVLAMSTTVIVSMSERLQVMATWVK